MRALKYDYQLREGPDVSIAGKLKSRSPVCHRAFLNSTDHEKVEPSL